MLYIVAVPVVFIVHPSKFVHSSGLTAPDWLRLSRHAHVTQDKYRGSDEERTDLLRHYTQFDGDMEELFRNQLCSEPELDSHRFVDMIEEAIKAGKKCSSYEC